MKAPALGSLFILIVTIWGTGCYGNCEDVCGDCFGDILNPPLGLKATAGDRQVTLTFDSANGYEGEFYEFWGFAAHMARGEYLSNPVSQNYYENEDIEAFDEYGDGCIGDCDGNSSGLMPVAYIEGGKTGVESALGVEIPGKVTWMIKNGDQAICEYYEYLEPCTATTDMTQEEIDDCTWGEGERICLENDVTYTVFVVSRYDNGTDVSWTSNWVSFTPTAATTTIE